MILPCDVASSHVSSSSSSSSSLHPCAVPSLSAPVGSIFTSMEHQQQSPEQLMAQYAAHVLRQHQQQAKPYSRRTPAAKPYSCEQCGRGFKYLHTLRFHIKTTHDSAAPAVEPRLSRLRRDAPPDLSSPGGAFCGAEQPTDDSREEDFSLPRPIEGRSQSELPPEFPQDAAPVDPAPPVKKEEVPDSYGPVKSESQDVPTTTSCVGSLSHMTAANLGSSLTAAGLPSPSSLLGMDAWRSMKLQAEVPLASKVDVVNPLTEQQYTLYKCGICGETQPSLRGLCDHLQAHTRAVKEHHCDKCGAVFKWRSQLLVHEQVHQVIEGKAGLPPPTGLPVLSPLPEALIGEPRVSFDQALQLGALAGHFLQPGSLPNLTMGLPLGMAPTTSVAPSSTSSVPEFTSPHCAAPPPAPAQRGPSSGSSKGGSSCPSSSQEAGMRLPFQCSYCSKSFDRIFSLQRHERIHTGVKPCYCKACGRGFSERRNLRHHIIRFHSDVSQRDQLRRRRRAAAARSRAAAVPAGGSANGGAAASGGDPADNPQGSLKLVSFLKKTAVRILNSVDQSKEEEDDDDMEDIDDLEDKADGDLDDEDDLRAGDESGFAENGSPDDFKEDHRTDGSNPELSDEERASPVAAEMPVALCTKDSGSPTGSLEADRKADDEEGEEDNKTIIYPLEAMPMATAPVESAQADEKSGGDGPLSSQDLDASNEELRRPATGNRRKKGRPMRYGPAVVETSEDCGSEKGADEGTGEVKEMRSAASEDRVAEDEVNPYTKEEMAAWMQLGKATGSSHENGEVGNPGLDGKAGTTGHGPFLSAYNCRMDMPERPMSRDEACTPQMGPDGKFVYPCSYCYKTFSSTSDLNRHMDFHEGIRQFLCRACSYHAVTQSDLSRHEKTRQHLVRQQNACPSCGLGFNSPTQLGDHALNCGAVRDLTAKVQSTEANNNDRSFESRNGELLTRPPADDSAAGHGGSRLEKSCVLLKKKLLCFEGAL